jgi:choline transport protein
MSTCAQPAFLVGTVVQGLLIQNYDGYVPKRWQGTLLMWAVMAIPLFCNIFCRRVLAPLEIIGGFTHFVGFIALVAVLLSMAPRGSAEFVFTQFITGASGWKSPGVQWSIGQLTAAFSLSGAFNNPLCRMKSLF